MLLHHDMSRPVGAWRSWQESAAGLYVKGALTMASRDAQEAHALARDGALTGLSIGYNTQKARPDHAAGVRDLLEVNLLEGSLVTVPSNPITHVAAIKAIAGARDIEAMLRETGVSSRRAKIAASAAWKAMNIDEPEDDDEVAAILKASAERLGAKAAARTQPNPRISGFDWS